MARILIADDETPTVRLLTLMLQRSNHVVVSARDGLEAMSKLTENEFDLLLTDINMPRMNGWELLRTIRTTTRFSELPVIVFSAGRLGDQAKALQEYRVNRFVMQPFSTAEINSAVEDCLHSV